MYAALNLLFVSQSSGVFNDFLFEPKKAGTVLFQLLRDEIETDQEPG
jgi:hypothetical protein